MDDHHAPLHRVIERPPQVEDAPQVEDSGAAEGPPPAEDPPPAEGAPHPDPPDAGAPAREGSRRPGGVRGAVHRPPTGHHSPPGGHHSPPGGDPGRGVPGRRVVLVHGFTQTLAAWGAVGERLARRWEVVRVDLPGHGGSGGVRVGFGEAAGLVGEAGGVATYVGYSLGGRVCLRLALDRPDLVRGLVLVGASPGIADLRARAERRRADEALADGIERDGVAAFLERWLAGPLFAGLSEEAAGRDDRLANTAEGLAYALRRLGTGAQAPLWERLGGLKPPTLLVAGALDAKFAAIAREMAAAVGPRARVELVPGAGHAVHLERPDAMAALIEEFLARRA